MSPPIRDGSGSSIGSIRLGDGTEISEVRTGAGDVLFSAIPDSVVLQYTATGSSVSDGSVPDDSGGTEAMALNGDPQDTTLSDGSDAIAFDNNGDYGLYRLPSQLESSGLEQFSWEICQEFTTSGNFTGITNGDDQSIQFGYEKDGTDTFSFFLRDKNNTSDKIKITDSSLFDGNRRSLSLAIDVPNGSVDAWVDGNSVSATFNGISNPNFGTWDYDIAYAARNKSGSISNDVNLTFGSMRWHDSLISSPTIQNYPF